MLTKGDWRFRPNEYVQRWLSDSQVVGIASGEDNTDHENQRQDDQQCSTDGTEVIETHTNHKNVDIIESIRSSQGRENTLYVPPEANIPQHLHHIRARPARGTQKRKDRNDEPSVEHHVDGMPLTHRQHQIYDTHSNDMDEGGAPPQHLPTLNKIKDLEQQNIDPAHDTVVDLSSKYARRPRHRTREDKYDFKGDQTSENPKNQGERQGAFKKRSRRKKTATALKDSFQASNVGAERLTLARTTRQGFLGKGKFSAVVAHRDVPDLTFPEMTFLSKRRKMNETEYDMEITDPRKQQTKQYANHEISNYFSRAFSQHTNERHDKTIATHDVQFAKDDTAQPATMPSRIGCTRNRAHSHSDISDNTNTQRSMEWKAHKASIRVSQFHPSTLHQNSQACDMEQGSPVSWSTSLSRLPMSAAHQRQRIAHNDILQEEHKDGSRHDKSPVHKEKDSRNIAEAPGDDVMYQYAQNTLMGLRYDLRRHISPGASNQQEISLEDLKRLARQSEMHDGVVNIHHRFEHSSARKGRATSALDYTLAPHVNPEVSQRIESPHNVSSLDMHSSVLDNDFFHARSDNNSASLQHSKRIGDLHIRPSAIQKSTKRSVDDNDYGTGVLLSRWLVGCQDIPEFPQLAPLELAASMRQLTHLTKDSRYEDVATQRSTDKSNLSNTQSPLRYTVRSKTADEVSNVLLSSNRLPCERVANFSPLPQMFPLPAGQSRTSGSSHSRLDRFDLEILDAYPSRNLYQDLVDFRPDMISDYAVADASLAPVQERVMHLGHYQRSVSYLHSEEPNGIVRNWIGAPRRSPSPRLRPPVGLSRPYLLF